MFGAHVAPLRRRGTAALSRLVLGIESSFDDTAVSLVDSGRRILASTIKSQDEVHAPFGGVQPKLAAQTHASTLPLVLRQYAFSLRLHVIFTRVEKSAGESQCDDERR